MSAGPLKSKYLKTGKRIVQIIEAVEKYSDLAKKSRDFAAVVEDFGKAEGGIWRGKKGFIAIPLPGVGAGVQAGTFKTQFMSEAFTVIGDDETE